MINLIQNEPNSRGDIIRFEKHILTSDGKLLNLADNTNHATLTNVTATTNQRGEANSAQSFNGSTSIGRISWFAGANVGANMSAFCSIYPTSVAAGSAAFFGKYDQTSEQRSWYIGRNGSKLRVVLSADGTATSLKVYESTTDIIINTHLRVGFTFSANVLKLFISGVEVAVTKITDNTVNSIFGATPDFTYGCILVSNAISNPFAGRLYDPILKNVTLTTEEVYDDFLEFAA